MRIERVQWRIVAEAAEAAGRNPNDIVRSTSLSISESWDVPELAG